MQAVVASLWHSAQYCDLSLLRNQATTLNICILSSVTSCTTSASVLQYRDLMCSKIRSMHTVSLGSRHFSKLCKSVYS